MYQSLYFGLKKKVDEFSQNQFEMKNIAGNVWEWVNDWSGVEHTANELTNPVKHIFKRLKY